MDDGNPPPIYDFLAYLGLDNYQRVYENTTQVIQHYSC
jgi:hypothetical protein